MTTAEILSRFSALRALVVGDICLDRWCTYDPALSEDSRETGIPRIGVVHTEVTAGAAGTVANNLAALGAGKVSVLGVIGDDGHGWELSRALALCGVSTDLCLKTQGAQTFTYTKVINASSGVEDLPRVDFIPTGQLDSAVEEQMIQRLRSACDSFDVILISDQAEAGVQGVITSAVRDAIAECAARFPGKVFMADSRTRIGLFRNVILKPNQQELNATGLAPRELLERLNAPVVMVTHGAKGVLVVERRSETWQPARVVSQPVDICGAGDSFAAGAALTLAVTQSPVTAARIGNLVASVTIMKKGTGTATPQEVLAAE